ncbi:MAG: PorT family protein [Muribaculaceae bacterium]|nr:PorT family protein [Muribaculaceae bacterium]
MRLNLLKLAVIMFAACPLSTMAQKWNFGVEAGYVNNTLAVEEYESTARNGFKFGVNAEYTLSNNVSVIGNFASSEIGRVKSPV